MTSQQDTNGFGVEGFRLRVQDLEGRPGGFPGGVVWIYVRWTPHPVIVTIRDNKDYIRVLLYSYYTTITGWTLRYTPHTLGLKPKSRGFGKGHGMAFNLMIVRFHV